jgi:hypothetical protein
MAPQAIRWISFVVFSVFVFDMFGRIGRFLGAKFDDDDYPDMPPL